MGFINLDTTFVPIDQTKMVISLWFRIPAATIAAATASYNAAFAYSLVNFGGKPEIFSSLIPLITWGHTHSQSGFSGTPNTNPSVIGVSVAPSDWTAKFNAWGTEPFKNSMYCCLATDVPAPSSFSTAFAGGTWDDFFEVGGFGNTVFIGNGAQQTLGPGINVVADKWHHILVSFDITNGSSASILDDGTFSINVASQFFWAFDDVNYNGQYLWPNCAANFSGDSPAVGQTGLNDIYSCFGNWIAALPGPGGTLPGGTQLSINPIGIPGGANVGSFVQKVEMAEFQLFSGISVDTSDLSIRRLFVTNAGTPADPTIAQGGLGEIPDVRFHRYQDFLAGINTGTAGNFDVTGSIVQFTPGPGLGV